MRTLRLPHRTALAAFAAAMLAIVLVVGLFRTQLESTLVRRVDAQLTERAATAPILVAIGDRLAASELNGTVEGARVAAGAQIVDLGVLPDGTLPDPATAGFSTASADGQRWRLLTVEVNDVPAAGDSAVSWWRRSVTSAERSASGGGCSSSGRWPAPVAGLLGALIGASGSTVVAAAGGTGAIEEQDPATWSVAATHGSPDVDEVAATLNRALDRLADEDPRRRRPRSIPARAFAASARTSCGRRCRGAMTISRWHRATSSIR
ncbi:MAG: hypothetical protein R2695_06265 [Acidimicrobiales bacterium]